MLLQSEIVSLGEATRSWHNSGELSRSFEREGLLRGLDVDPEIDRFPHVFQIEFLESVVPRLVPKSLYNLIIKVIL
jgi:hypothetical protein